MSWDENIPHVKASPLAKKIIDRVLRLCEQGSAGLVDSQVVVQILLEEIPYQPPTHGYGCPHDGDPLTQPKPTDCVCDDEGETPVQRHAREAYEATHRD